MTDQPAVSFLCVHNGGRSQMCAGRPRHLAGDRVDMFSGGSDPGDSVDPTAVAATAEAGVDISGASPQRWTDETVRAAEVVVSMGCGDVCPVYPGKRYEDWELTDPRRQPIEVVCVVRDEVCARVEQLLVELGVTPA